MRTINDEWLIEMLIHISNQARRIEINTRKLLRNSEPNFAEEDAAVRSITENIMGARQRIPNPEQPNQEKGN